MKTAAGIALALAALIAPVGAAAQQAPDAATMDAARTMVLQILPDGSYARMMEQSMDQIVAMSMESVMDLPMRDLAAIGGLDDGELAQVGPGTMREMMEILDPHFTERQNLSMRAMMSGMTTVMTEMEPELREGISEAYAQRFTASELDEITRFFQTPTGGKYAASAMTIYTDPAVMAKMQAMMPNLMKAMPAIIADTKAATDHLPPPRSIDELTDEEREKLGQLVGQNAD